MEWTDFIDKLKDYGVILGFVLSLGALVINWKTIFRPYKKKLADREFDSIAILLKEISNPKLQSLYYSNVGIISFEYYKQILLDIGNAMSSPFLPNSIKTESKNFYGSLIVDTTFTMNFYISQKSSNDPESITILNKTNIFKTHQLFYEKLMMELKKSNYEFPFTYQEDK